MTDSETPMNHSILNIGAKLKERPKTDFKHAFRNFLMMPEVNKSTLYYYGSAEAIRKEKERVSQQNAWVVHPYGMFRRWWLIVMLLATFYDMIVVPLGVSFLTEYDRYSKEWIAVNVGIDFLFLADLVLNFRTGYMSKDTQTVTLDARKISFHYFKSWFLTDLIGVAPIDYAFIISGAALLDSSTPALDVMRGRQLIQLSRLFSLLRLLRFSRFVRYANNWVEVTGLSAGGYATAIQFTHMIITIILVCHWNACFQFLVATVMEYPKNSWVTLDGLVGKSMSCQYTKSMFRSLCHMMALNYGSVSIPKGEAELWVVITSMLVGTVMYALILARMTALVYSSKASEHVYDSKYKETMEYMKHYRLPRDLRRKVIGHLENCYQGRWFDEKAILMDLSEPLRREVIHHNSANLVLSMPMFKDTNRFFISELLMELELEIYQMNDLIIRKGDHGDCMYFIEKGSVNVECDKDIVLSDGDFFGEMCLISGKGRRNANVWALTPCRLYSLSFPDYRNVLKRFPELKDKIDAVAKQRLQNTDDLYRPSQEIVCPENTLGDLET